MSDPVAVLVVDDNPPQARTLVDILAAKGYLARSSHDGMQAVEILRRERVDILISDVIMPGLDGVALYRRARELQPHIFSILMTAYSADSLIQQGIAEGVKTILTKPLDIDFLLRLLEAAKASYFHSTRLENGAGSRLQS